MSDLDTSPRDPDENPFASPGRLVDEPTDGFESRVLDVDFQPMRGVGKTLALACGLLAASSASALLTELGSADPFASGDAARVAHAALLVFYLVAFVVWIVRAQRNLSALGARALRFTPLAAVVWSTLPLVNLWSGLVVLLEVWWGSDPRRTAYDARSPGRGAARATTAAPLVGWWIAEIVSLVLSLGDTLVSHPVGSEGGEMWAFTTALAVVSGVLDVALPLVGAGIFWHLSLWQERKARERALSAARGGVPRSDEGARGEGRRASG